MSSESKKVLVQKELQRLEAQLCLAECPLDDSNRICMAVVERRLLPTKPPRIVAASSLYACCRQRQSSIGLKEIAIASDVSREDIGRAYRSIVLSMDIMPPGVDEAACVTRLAEKAHRSEEAVGLAQAIIREADRRALGGRKPMTRATAALCIACRSIGESVTLLELADAAGIGEASVRGCIKTFRQLTSIPNLLQHDGVLGEESHSLPAPSSFERAASTDPATIQMTTA